MVFFHTHSGGLFFILLLTLSFLSLFAGTNHILLLVTCVNSRLHGILETAPLADAVPADSGHLTGRKVSDWKSLAMASTLLYG